MYTYIIYQVLTQDEMLDLIVFNLIGLYLVKESLRALLEWLKVIT